MRGNRKRTASAVLSVVIVGSLVTGGHAQAATNLRQIAVENVTTSPAGALTVRTGFTDVPTAHWAYKYATKLALLNLVQGVDNERYAPDNSVSQQDAIIMVVRLLGLEKEAQAINASTFVLPFAVSAHAKQYVILADEKGYISRTEEAATVSASSTEWGSREATREWIARLVISALGNQTGQYPQDGSPASFTDQKDISDWALSYVQEAVKLKIVNGFTDGSFKPKNKVTRAEMAAFISRAEQYANFKSDRLFAGVVSAISGSSIQVKDKDGISRSFSFSPDSRFFSAAQEGQSINANQIKVGYPVYVIQQQGLAYYTEILAEQVQVFTEEGWLDSLDVPSMKLFLRNGNKVVEYSLSSSVAVLALDESGMNLNSLAKNSKLLLKRELGEPTGKITSIQVKEYPMNFSAIGTIAAVDRVSGQITITDESGKEAKYPVVEAAKTMWAAWKEGNRIHYSIVNSEMNSLEIIPEITGQIRHIELNGSDRYLTIRNTDNTLATYEFDSLVKVIVPDTSIADLTDLKVGDNISLEINTSNLVTKVTAKQGVLNTTYMTTIIAYDTVLKILTVSDDTNVGAFKLSSSTVLEFMGNNVPFDVFTNLFTKGKKIDVTMAGENVSRIRLSHTYEGAVTAFNASTGALIVRLEDGFSVTFRTNASTLINGIPQGQGDGNLLKSLTTGAKVKVTYGTDQVFIQQIQTL